MQEIRGRAERKPRGLRPKLGVLVISAILLAPSIWMLATIPPLWRDLDAYHQVTLSPGKSTAVGHGPLYGLVVRLPLFLGYEVERLTKRVAPVEKGFFQHPRLTDSGIFLLILSQHLGMAGAALILIVGVTRNLWLQLLFAVLFASNSLFYTFAQCVGSESLSLICLLLVVSTGLRVFDYPREPPARAWILFSLALLAAVSTRYANLLLILLLPLSYALMAAGRRSRKLLRMAAISLAIGLGCLVGARVGADVICRTAGLKYYPRFGFTFLWRLHFLQNLSEEQRTALLDQVEARTSSGDARQVLEIVRQSILQGTPLDSRTFLESVRQALSAHGERVKTKRVFEALNRAAVAILSPPPPALWRAAEKDFSAICRLPLSAASSFLFRTTNYYFNHKQVMPDVAPLSTFKQHAAAELRALPERFAYFRLGRAVSLNGALAVLVIQIVALLLVSRAAATDHSRLVYGIVLVAIGLAITFITALIGELIPRYTLPLWESLWAASLVIGSGIESKLTAKQSGCDPFVQRQRLLEQPGEETQKLHEDFLFALEHGMPPAGGSVSGSIAWRRF